MLIAIIGRPNVGKSSLFNKLIKKQIAIIDDVAGVTRDRKNYIFNIDDDEFEFVDTPGLDFSKEIPLADHKFFDEKNTTKAIIERMANQTKLAISEADLCIYLFDSQVGLIDEDFVYSDYLHKNNKKTILIGSKYDGKNSQYGIYEGLKLGFGEPIALSVMNDTGIADLWQRIFAFSDELKKSQEFQEYENDNEKPLRVSIIGRPNVGKSTLMNSILNENRVVTGAEAGITRDVISHNFTSNALGREWKIKLSDTAGLRKKNKSISKLEKLASSETKHAINFSEVVLFLFDATKGIMVQEKKILQDLIDEGRAFILVANKWDLITNKKERREEIQYEINKAIDGNFENEFLFISALNKKNLEFIMPKIIEVYALWNAEISTKDLNKFLDSALKFHNPPLVRGKSIKLKYITQTSTRPPRFTIFGNRVALLPNSYRNYLQNKLRERFELSNIPFKIFYKSSTNPFGD